MSYPDTFSSLIDSLLNYRKIHGRILVGSFLIVMFVLTTGYKGTLISFLTAHQESTPMNSVAELSEAIKNVRVRLQSHRAFSNPPDLLIIGHDNCRNPIFQDSYVNVEL